MADTVMIDGQSYDPAQLSARARDLLHSITTVDARLAAMEQRLAAMRTARQTCLDGLKSDIVAGRTGVDLSDLFAE